MKKQKLDNAKLGKYMASQAMVSRYKTIKGRENVIDKGKSHSSLAHLTYIPMQYEPP